LTYLDRAQRESARVMRRRCGSTSRRPPLSAALMSSRPPAAPTGRWRLRPVLPRRPRCSRTRSAPDGSARASRRASDRSLSRLSGRASRLRARPPPDPHARRHRQAGLRAAAPLCRLWTLPLQRCRPLPPSGARMRGLPSGSLHDSPTSPEHPRQPDQGRFVSAGLVRGRGRGAARRDRPSGRRCDHRGCPPPRRVPSMRRRAHARPHRARA